MRGTPVAMLQIYHLLGVQPVEAHDERAQGIAMGGDDHTLARKQLRQDALLEKGSTRAAVSFRLSPPGGPIS